MKKIKLTLNKETIAKLEDKKMDAVKGGTGNAGVCYSHYPTDCPSVFIKCTRETLAGASCDC